MKFSLATIAFAAVITSAPAIAEETPLNTPNAGAWNIYGPGQTVKNFKDDTIPGGGGRRVIIAKATQNAWDIGANVTVDKPIKKGDHLTFAAYLKIESKDDPNASLDIPATIQINSAPYSAIIQGNVHITTAWKLVYIAGTADKDYAGNGATAAVLNLGGDPKVIDLGPAFVMAGSGG